VIGLQDNLDRDSAARAGGEAGKSRRETEKIRRLDLAERQ
jgi:hypothetical protein